MGRFDVQSGRTVDLSHKDPIAVIRSQKLMKVLCAPAAKTLSVDPLHPRLDPRPGNVVNLRQSDPRGSSETIC